MKLPEGFEILCDVCYMIPVNKVGDVCNYCTADMARERREDEIDNIAKDKRDGRPE